MMFSPDKKFNKMKPMEFDDFEGSDYDQRPESRVQRGASKGKDKLGVNEDVSSSDNEDTLSVRRRRNSNIQKLRKKGNLNLDERSDYSGDEDPVSRVYKEKK